MLTIDKLEDILVTNDGYLVSHWFAFPIKATKDINCMR